MHKAPELVVLKNKYPVELQLAERPPTHYSTELYTTVFSAFIILFLKIGLSANLNDIKIFTIESQFLNFRNLTCLLYLCTKAQKVIGLQVMSHSRYEVNLFFDTELLLLH